MQFNKCFIIAEIGINANSSVEIAKKLIDIAKFAGCDAVKFQKRTVDVVYSPEELLKPRETPFGSTNGDLKRALEFGLDDYAEIDKYCKEKEIPWFASCWDIQSVDFIEQFNPPIHKIASACITDEVLIQKIRSTGKYIIMSTGMSDMKVVKKAVGCIGYNNLALLHCIGIYPAKPEDLNLNAIRTLQKEFPSNIVGYSGHEVGLSTTVAAVAMGAKIVERHITLDRAMWGSDQAASVEPQGLIKLVRDIRNVESAMGDGVKRICDAEYIKIKTLRRGPS
jgi:N-acetylneuraminate synthase